MQIVPSNKCMGCGACANVCPKNCIRMEYDLNGFVQHYIDDNLCIECCLCRSVCPSLNVVKNNNYHFPISYACWNKSNEILKNSTSGGIYPAFAEHIIDNGGVVFASVMDENLEVSFQLIDNLESIAKSVGSKYTQSLTKDIFTKIKSCLADNKKVLFIGTPCQVASVYAYLGKNRIDNLFTLDLVCHGVASTSFFTKYIKFQETNAKKKIVNFVARDKKRGWSNLTVKLLYNDMSVKYIKSVNDVFMKAYYAAVIYRDICYNCPYSKLPRVADVTLGDYFSINKTFVPSYVFDKGLSVLLVNNEKGKVMLDMIRDKLSIVERPLEESTENNTCIVLPMQRPRMRDEILKEFNNLTMTQIDQKYCQYGLKTKISLILGSKLTKFIQRFTHAWRNIK